jgi:hypothetical protein
MITVCLKESEEKDLLYKRIGVCVVWCGVVMMVSPHHIPSQFNETNISPHER